MAGLGALYYKFGKKSGNSFSVDPLLFDRRNVSDDILYNDKNDDAQAPGKPTENDGYTPPKKWDGKKVTHPRTGDVGWPDDKGHVWVPTGPGPKAHGGPHWDR